MMFASLNDSLARLIAPLVQPAHQTIIVGGRPTIRLNSLGSGELAKIESTWASIGSLSQLVISPGNIAATITKGESLTGKI